MPGNQNRKKIIKKVQKELDKLQQDYKKTELRPCLGDADLRQREKDLEMLKEKIRVFEKELDLYWYP
jgi:hypothetical protein